MMERDDLTVVSEGLADELKPELWNPSFIAGAAGTEYYHKFRKFQRRKTNTKDTEACGDGAPISSVTHDEVDQCVSMKVKDYFRYLDTRRSVLAKLAENQKGDGQQSSTASPCRKETVSSAEVSAGIVSGVGAEVSEGVVAGVVEGDVAGVGAKDESESQTRFTFTDDSGKEHFIDVVETVLYMLDFDIIKLFPQLNEDFKSCFKLPGCLPGGSHCMMNAVSRSMCRHNLCIIHQDQFSQPILIVNRSTVVDAPSWDRTYT